MIMNFEDANFNIKSYFAQSDYSTGDSGARASSLQWLISATFPQIVVKEVNDTAAADNRVRTHKLYLVVEKVKFWGSILVGLDVTKISHMTVTGAWTTMMLSKRIKMRGKAITTVLVIS